MDGDEENTALLEEQPGDGCVFTLMRMLPWQRLMYEQLPTVAVAWLLAEMFYKWHSFSLEMLGFLATWFVLDAVVQGVRQLVAPRRRERG